MNFLCQGFRKLSSDIHSNIDTYIHRAADRQIDRHGRKYIHDALHDVNKVPVSA